jgi:hypothetical protein
MTLTNERDQETTWISCGENCMPINVLRRHGKIAPSTPFSSGRSDVEHLEYFESTNYENFLDPSYLIQVKAFTGECFINVSKKSSGRLKPGRHTYLELTHHNPLILEDRKLLNRRIQRMSNIRRESTPHCLFYHHRSLTGFTQTRALIKEKMLSILNKYNRNTTALCYTQQIVSEKSQRGIDVIEYDRSRILFITLRTTRPWAGSNLDIFFGTSDDDLFKKLFQIQKIKSSKAINI